MKPDQTDVVTEYLREVELRLSGLPLLQRRELLADLAAHIESERADRNAISEGALIEILERLGSPEVVAAAAYEEAGVFSAPSGGAFGGAPVGPPPVAPPPPFIRPAPAPPRRNLWIFTVLAVVGVVVVLCLGMALTMSRDASPAEQAPPEPVPAASF
ncbi:HAAS signaling domain-containing protein [Actinoplanes awajinensis]|uniref:Uncharacterized protein n=1 Tax=Actinoplanes awajinensis subsp. mycoplanecinus TaxID=135947 RepID=A0A117MRV0_9ACTN|nr:hypothetical protein [Actinoplanes awajinensis]KUL32321.1 hypothetical protein ADL15_20035 [Actinoplanes awajinensis subsp. mycoplanecinus]